MCNYCGYEHGIIGDVVCPIKKDFPTSYSSKKVFTDTWPAVLEVSWPVREPICKIEVNPDEPWSKYWGPNKDEFKEYMSKEANIGGRRFDKSA